LHNTLCDAKAARNTQELVMQVQSSKLVYKLHNKPFDAVAQTELEMHQDQHHSITQPCYVEVKPVGSRKRGVRFGFSSVERAESYITRAVAKDNEPK